MRASTHRRFLLAGTALLSLLAVNAALLVTPGVSPAQGRISSRHASYRGSKSDRTWLSSNHPGMRWDPVGKRNGHDGRTITWHYDGAGSRGRVSVATVKNGLAPIAAATGFRFVKVATTGKADIHIGWRRMQGSLVGRAGPTSTKWLDPGDRQATILRGRLTLNTRAPRWFKHWKALITHEAGHVMGLGHATGTNQVMHPICDGTSRLGAGDVAGLRRVSVWRGEVR